MEAVKSNNSKPLNSYFNNQANVSQEKKYTKINLSKIEISFRMFVIVITLGIARAILNVQFENALLRGDIEAAEKAIRWGACNYLDKFSLINLSRAKQPESLKFLSAQIIFNTRRTDGGSKAAKEFIEARDDCIQIGYQRKAIADALPNTRMPQVYFSTVFTPDQGETRTCSFNRPRTLDNVINPLYLDIHNNPINSN